MYLTHGSVVGGYAGDDEHQVEGDDELEDERLHVGARRHRPEEAPVPAAEQQTQRPARQRRAQHLGHDVRRHLHQLKELMSDHCNFSTRETYATFLLEKHKVKI